MVESHRGTAANENDSSVAVIIVPDGFQLSVSGRADDTSSHSEVSDESTDESDASSSSSWSHSGDSATNDVQRILGEPLCCLSLPKDAGSLLSMNLRQLRRAKAHTIFVLVHIAAFESVKSHLATKACKSAVRLANGGSVPVILVTLDGVGVKGLCSLLRSAVESEELMGLRNRDLLVLLGDAYVPQHTALRTLMNLHAKQKRGMSKQNLLTMQVAPMADLKCRETAAKDALRHVLAVDGLTSEILGFWEDCDCVNLTAKILTRPSGSVSLVTGAWPVAVAVVSPALLDMLDASFDLQSIVPELVREVLTSELGLEAISAQLPSDASSAIFRVDSAASMAAVCRAIDDGSVGEPALSGELCGALYICSDAVIANRGCDLAGSVLLSQSIAKTGCAFKHSIAGEKAVITSKTPYEAAVLLASGVQRPLRCEQPGLSEENWSLSDFVAKRNRALLRGEEGPDVAASSSDGSTDDDDDGKESASGNPDDEEDGGDDLTNFQKDVFELVTEGLANTEHLQHKVLEIVSARLATNSSLSQCTLPCAKAFAAVLTTDLHFLQLHGKRVAMFCEALFPSAPEKTALVNDIRAQVREDDVVDRIISQMRTMCPGFRDVA